MENESLRDAYGNALRQLGAESPDIVVLDADVSKSTKTCFFQESFPERFFNFGIAEQNMMAAAAGMATLGLIPFVNSFSFLTTFRAADQFRTSIAYPRLNVKVASHLSGLSDSFDGPTHQTIADVALVRSLPNTCVLVPSDAEEVRQSLPAALCHEGPVWLRLSRANPPIIPPENGGFQIGKAVKIRDGSDVTIISCGVVLHRVMEAVEELTRRGYDPMVVSMPTLKPLDVPAVVESAKKTKAIVTVEEHNIVGGLGSAVCETLAGAYPVPVERLGIPDCFAETGPYEALLDRYGLAVNDIIEAAVKLVERRCAPV